MSSGGKNNLKQQYDELSKMFLVGISTSRQIYYNKHG